VGEDGEGRRARGHARPQEALTIARLLFLLALAGCSAGQAEGRDAAAPDALRIPVTIQTDSGERSFASEVADSHEERMRGLMFRTSMKDDEGMIFLFPREEQLSFWMRNTLIPLDMIFVKADRTILGVVENAQPRTDTPRFVQGKSQFVLEVNGGLAKKLGIKAGQAVSFFAPIPDQ
jgi:uncharacterized protein